jgi:cobalt-zinc-cadmium resistance protein CzcA
MLESIITWSLGNRRLVLLGAVVVAALGTLALRGLNVDAFPDTTPIQIQVNTQAPGMVPEEVERQVTFPVELAMNGMPGVAEVRSISMFGLSQVVVTFADGTDVYFARQLIYERLGAVELPAGLNRPQMGPVSTGLGEVFHYFLIGRGTNLTDLRTKHDWDVKPLLRTVPGTAEVNSWGGLEKQYQVRIDPTLLLKYDLTFNQVMQAVCDNNLNVGGGSIDVAGDNLLIHGVGRTIGTKDVGDIVVAAKDGVPIHVSDVAEVVIGHEIRRGAVTATTRDPADPAKLAQSEVVLGLGFMLMGRNSYEVTADMRKKFEDVTQSLADDGTIETVVAYDRTQLVDRVIATVKNNLLEGATLVVLILYVFLGNLRAGLICAVAIPLSMLVGFCGMWWAGIAGSLLSLGAIDFGVVVDSSVVVVEAIVARLGHLGPVWGWRRREAIREAAVSVRTPACFGQLIIMIVYLPILSLEGVEGKMFRPMAWTVIFVLIGSLICCLTVTPVLSLWLLPRRCEEKDVLFVAWAKRLYGAVLRVLLPLRAAVVVGAVALLAGGGWLVAQMGSEFVPRLSEGAVVIGIMRPPGTSLDEGVRMNQVMERILMEKFPDEVRLCWSRLGSPEVPTDAGTIETTDLFIELYPPDRWKAATTQVDLVAAMEKELKDIPGQTIWFTQPIEQRLNEMISGVRADVALKLFGDDFDELVATARKLQATLSTVPGAADLSTEQMLGQPVLRIAIKQEQIARYGISARSVLDIVESLGTKALGNVVEGQLRFPLVVRLPESMRNNPEVIANIMLSSPKGERVPLSRLCDIRVVDGPRLISREWGDRRITVQCNVRGRDVGSFVAEAQQRIAAGVALPDGYRIEWGGQFENMRRAQRRLAVVVPIALALIAGLLYLSFRNQFDTITAFAGVPFAAVGGLAALWLREMPLSISSAVGFITLSGISVLNSMVLITKFRELARHEASAGKAIVEAGIECLRTILMTALVAGIGFVPMASSNGAGAEVQRPLATVVIGGVLVGTIYTLVVLPILYAWFAKTKAATTPSPVGTDTHHGELVAAH